jgi:PTS system nitrogen regulatory IIA component
MHMSARAIRMPYRNMSLEELARHIGMDARTVRKWAERGKLPGQKVGGEWRFNRAQMLDWLQRELHTLGDEHVRNLERAMRDGGRDRPIGAHLALEAIDVNLAAKSRPSVLRELVRLAEHTGLVYDGPHILAALEEREELGSTALPGGIAFPHPRRPLPYATAESLVCLGRVPAGVPYGAPDGGLTDIFVLVVAHDEREHLGLLARLAMMFNSDLPAALRETDSPEVALKLLLDAETRVVVKG